MRKKHRTEITIEVHEVILAKGGQPPHATHCAACGQPLAAAGALEFQDVRCPAGSLAERVES